MSTPEPAQAAALLPAAVAAVLDAHSRALADLDQVDAVAAVGQIRQAQAATAAAETDLLAVAVLAGHPITPACYAVGTAPVTLRKYLEAAAA